MVNVGGSFGPIVAGHLRAISSGTPSTCGYVLAAHFALAIVGLNVFVKVFGEFREQEG
jgi:hypothetical protein